MMCEAFLVPHHVASHRVYRPKVVLGPAEWGSLGLIIGPGGPQRLLILCGNPPPKAAGSFLCYRGDVVWMIGLFVVALLLVVALVGGMLWLFFLRGR
jgi:hypothetical protein